MDKKKVFGILDISETRDAKEIKMAYRNKLLHVNPEDDPEGFKVLREAYEEAIRLINTEEEEGVPETPITLWIQKVEKIYKRLSSRTNVDNWRELFEEDICKDFDTCDEVKEEFLKFLMSNYRLPAAVWELIEESFEFRSSKEELYEKFPNQFIDFVIDDPESKNWWDFSLFEGEDEADTDGFINHYLSVRRMNDYNQFEGAAEVYEQLGQIDLWHPYLQVEKMRYYMANGKAEEGAKIAEELRARKYADLYVKYYIAEVSLESGDIERAFEECNEILEARPNHFGAKKLISCYYLKKKEYKIAKEKYLDLLDIDRYDEGLSEGLRKTNDGLIQQYKEQLESDPNNKEIRLELGWCLFQNGLYEDCRILVQAIDVDADIYYDYYNLMSRVYLATEDHKKAFPYVKVWLEEILKTEDDGTKEKQARLRRLPYAYYAMYECYYNFAKEKDNDEENISQCFKYLDLCIGAEGSGNDIIMYLSAKAKLLLKLEDNKGCIDVCDEILRINSEYFPAYMYRQEAYFNLRMGREVIDDYYKAIEIYPAYAKAYILAVKVYINYDRYEDALEVIKRAKDTGVESNELSFQELKVKRITAESNNEREKVLKDIEKLYEKVKQEVGDMEDISSLPYEKALCYFDMEAYSDALEVIEENLKLNPFDYDSITLKADILFNQRNYEAALNSYKKVIEKYTEYAYGYYRVGNCFDALNKEKEALDNYLKVIEIDPEHQHVYNKLLLIYKRRYQENYRKEDYDKAVGYGKQQIENNSHSYYYNELGRLYLEGYEFCEAIKAFDEAINGGGDVMYYYNNKGYTYQLMGNFDEAIKYLKLAIEHIDDGDFLPYWNKALCYKITGQYEEAIKIYEMLIDKGDSPKEAFKKLMNIYKEIKDWDKALEQANKIFEIDKADEMDYLLDCGDIHANAGNKRSAIRYYKKAISKYSRKAEPYIHIGDYLLWILGNRRRALRYYYKAYDVSTKYDSKYYGRLNSILYGISNGLRSLGKLKKCTEALKEFYKFIDKEYGGIEQWLANPGHRRARLFQIAVCHYNVGDYEKTKYYMSRMKECGSCSFCTYCKCYEYLLLEGMLMEQQGDYSGALAKYEEAHKITPTCVESIFKVKEMKEKLRVR